MREERLDVAPEHRVGPGTFTLGDIGVVEGEEGGHLELSLFPDKEKRPSSKPILLRHSDENLCPGVARCPGLTQQKWGWVPVQLHERPEALPSERVVRAAFGRSTRAAALS